MVKIAGMLCGAVLILIGLTLSPVPASTGQEKEEAESCVKPAGGVLQKTPSAQGSVSHEDSTLVSARVGKPAPDFEATAFQNGAFRNLRLSDYKGKWLVLCFYPGDFTFV